MDILSNAAGSATTCILEHLWNPIERHVGYLVQYQSNLENLREQVRELEAVKNGILKQVDDAQNKGEEIEDVVLNWHVNAIQLELDVELLEDEIHKGKGCCHVWHLDWRSRHRFGRRAKKKHDKIVTHLLKGNFEMISLPPRTVGLKSLPTSDFITLKTSMVALNQIMELLKDGMNNVNIIGVHGTGGIGKTTLMKQLVKQAEEEKLFDGVVFARVSQTPNLKIIQDTIAKLLGFEIKEDFKDLRAATLSDRLKRRRKVLIILDDLWERLDLAEVGIPYGSEHKGCKIVVTSRLESVCNSMESHKNVLIEKLTDEDSLDLFKIKAGLPDHSHRAAEVVVKQCGNLPNSIIIMGRALRNKPPNEWNDAIKKERESTAIKVDGIPEEVVLCVTVGYDQLEEVTKGCLQFVCLFPAYYSVSMEELIIYGLVDRLFPDVSTLGEVWDKMVEVVAHLKSSNLLLEGDGEGYFRVHDDTRKVVKYITSERGNNVVYQAGLKKRWPEEDLQQCEKMSLMDSGVTQLPDQPDCPRLLTLFLQNNALEDIPVQFFEHMRSLKFVDLSYNNISELPPSLLCVEELRSLRLENTHLTDASLIGGLNRLEVLIIRGSSIAQLPNELEKMTQLKLLDLSNNLFLEEIPANVISKLSQLEELYSGNSFGDWEVAEATNQQKAEFSEVASLTRLAALHIHVKNTKCLSMNFDGPWKNLKKFRICVNDDYWDIASTKSMHLKNLSYPLANWVRLLFEKSEHLALSRSKDLEDIMQKDVHGVTGLKSFHLRACNVDRIFRSSLFLKVQNLEDLRVEYCYSLKEVFYLEEIEEESTKLTRLREVILVGLPKLMTIWMGNHSVAYFENLKSMKVKECGKLRNLFSKTLAQGLHQLEHLTILNCNNMEDIISNDQAEVEQEAAHTSNFSNIQPPMFFQTLQKLIISKCNKMKSVLSLTFVQGLQQLKELTVVSCNQMEEIITMTDEEKEAENENIVPQLRILCLQDLSELHTLYKGNMLLKLLSLEELQIWNCPNLKKLPLASRSAPKLRKLRGKLAWFENLEPEDKYIKIRLQALLTEEE